MTDTWQKITAAIRELKDTSDYDREAELEDVKDSLLEERNREIEEATPRPQCCEIGKTYQAVFPALPVAAVPDPDLTPMWFTLAGGMRTRVPVAFCPFCGAKLPGFRKKADPPPHLRRVEFPEDRDETHCHTCGRGWCCCYCDPPWNAWEIDE